MPKGKKRYGAKPGKRRRKNRSRYQKVVTMYLDEYDNVVRTKVRYYKKR